MPDSEVQIDFDAPAALRKWPSVNNERVSASLGARPYLIIDGTLDECIRKFMSQPVSQRHLYEIHTAPQSDLVSSVLSAEHIVELTRLRDFLYRPKSLLTPAPTSPRAPAMQVIDIRLSSSPFAPLMNMPSCRCVRCS